MHGEMILDAQVCCRRAGRTENGRKRAQDGAARTRGEEGEHEAYAVHRQAQVARKQSLKLHRFSLPLQYRERGGRGIVHGSHGASHLGRASFP